MRLAAQYVKRGGVVRVGWLEKIDHGVWGAPFTQTIGGNAPLEKSSGAFFYNEVEDCLFDSCSVSTPSMSNSSWRVWMSSF